MQWVFRGGGGVPSPLLIWEFRLQELVNCSFFPGAMYREIQYFRAFHVMFTEMQCLKVVNHPRLIRNQFYLLIRKEAVQECQNLLSNVVDSRVDTCWRLKKLDFLCILLFKILKICGGLHDQSCWLRFRLYVLRSWSGPNALSEQTDQEQLEPCVPLVAGDSAILVLSLTCCRRINIILNSRNSMHTLIWKLQ